MRTPEMQVRDLNVKEKFKLSKFLVQWEMILVYILIAINVFLIILRPNLYFESGTIQTIIRSGMDLSIMVLGMIFILMLGDIDVSVGSIMIVSCMVMGLLYDAGMPSIIAVLGGIIAGGICGAFNGTLVAKFKMPAVIVTIATSMLFRGIVEIVLDVNTLKNYPSWFSTLAWGDLGGILPYSMIFFLVIGAVFAVVLHKTKFGRELYIIGNSPTVAEYSGIRVVRVKIIVFVIMGCAAALSGILFAGRRAGISSGMGSGYELQAIAIAVLGGVSTKGGKGKAYGPIIATFIMAFLSKTLDLLEVHANTQKIIIGVILLVAVMIPMVNKDFIAGLKLRFLYMGDKNIEALNNKSAAEQQELKTKIAEAYADNSLSAAERKEKVDAYNAEITTLRAKCAEATKKAKQDLKEQRAQNKNN